MYGGELQVTCYMMCGIWIAIQPLLEDFASNNCFQWSTSLVQQAGTGAIDNAGQVSMKWMVSDTGIM